jgi:LPS export ABC transporter protein LptC
MISCSNVQEDNPTPGEEKQYPDQESWNAVITLTKEGIKRALVNAGHLTKNNNEAQIVLDENVDVDFFDENQRYLSHLKSLTAQVNERTNDLLAQGNVVVVSDSGVTLFTEELHWDHQRERIYSDAFVTFITDNDTLMGVGFESDSDLQNWVIEKPSGVTDREFKESKRE